MEKRLGKIISVKFGHVGYQNAQLGLSIVLGNDGWGIGDSRAYWDANLVNCSKHAEWTEEDRSKGYADIMCYISDLLSQAKVHTVEELVDIPVEITLNDGTFEKWRVLTEVI